MAKTLIPRNKQARREGIDLSLKTPGTKGHARLLKRLNVTPGTLSTSRTYRKKQSEFGRQLREKQKLKRMYGLTEKTMSRYFTQSVARKGNTIEFIIQSLELRLDNALYRAGFAPTRSAARQLVTHGHVNVNSKKNSIPSFSVSVGDVIAFRSEKTEKIPYIQEYLETEHQLPVWVKKEAKGFSIAALPTQQDYAEPIDLPLVIEFYSKL